MKLTFKIVVVLELLIHKTLYKINTKINSREKVKLNLFRTERLRVYSLEKINS